MVCYSRHLRLTLDIDTRGEPSMEDWIDDLREKEDKAKAGDREREQLKLHQIQVVNSKLPDFGESVLESIRKDCRKLQEIFPGDPKKHCQTGLLLRGIHLEGTSYPRRIIHLEMDESKLFIHLAESLVRDRGQDPSQAVRSEIKVACNIDDDLQLHIHGKLFMDADRISQYLVCHALGIEKPH